MDAAVGVLGLVLLVPCAAFAWRLASRRRHLPCPAFFAPLFETRLGHRALATRATLDALRLAPGHRVLDAGCGAGRLTPALARAVGPEGTVVALDAQEKMLRRLRARTTRANVRTLQARLGVDALPEEKYDRIVLAGVLGEIPDRKAALRALRHALAPDGLLVVAETSLDPHYVPLRTLRRLAHDAGLDLIATRKHVLGHVSTFAAGPMLEADAAPSETTERRVVEADAAGS